ncbi:2129_t:CDS:10 [Funneliformis geosporum]|nr:2129_t:CDS:10 [Funneliformis geosporum]
MEQEISKLILLWTFCGLTCHLCGLKCVKNQDNEEYHDCLTDHKCNFLYHFNEVHNIKSIPTCSFIAGQEGKHACNEVKHLCGESCSLIDKRNCQQVCSKVIGHYDLHLCQSLRHYCGEACSLSTKSQKGDYHCPNKCIVPYEERHDSHRCENETCPIQCPISDCQRKCQSNEHFHSDSNSQVDHFCGNEHQCRELCEEAGICNVIVEPKKQEEIYKGLVEETSITFTKYIQLSERLRCNKRIPPNAFKHTGKHTHHASDDLTQNGFHFCDVKCQFCEYFCTLPNGHTQNHNTTNGNMIQTEFTGEDNEFEYAGHKLRVGDQGIFVPCNLICKDLGRHRHISYCQSKEICQGQDIQHISEQVHPNPSIPKDFISHKLFWERTGFKDPYSVQEQHEFAKCDHECPDEKHHRSRGSTNDSAIKSFCELPLFHAQLNPNSNLPNDYGYISMDGHHFNCDNPSTREVAFHIIFVLDRSGSMGERDRKPIQEFSISNYLKYWNHNNRLGAVYHAVYQLLNARINSVKTNQVINDKISLILFNNEVIVPIENQDLKDPKDPMKMLDIMIQHHPDNGSNFILAIQKAGSLISSYHDPTRTNIIIFLSDGECYIPEKQLHEVFKENQSRGSLLYLYTVLFSSNSASSSLEEMAKIAQSYHTNYTSSGCLRSQFTRAINEISLVNHFTSIAESLRKHKPTLLKKDLIMHL